MASDHETRYQITREGLDALEAELHELETTARQEISERIKTARDFGDLKENSEYHDAKDQQAHLETKILVLRDRTSNAVVVESGSGGTTIGLGSRVRVRDEDSGSESSYELVSSLEADASAGRLSFDSPLAQAIRGGEVGQVIEFAAPKRTRRLRVLEVS